MKVVITMAGLGTRFADHGFTEPKYKLRIDERSLLEISLQSLAQFFGCASFVFIGLEESLDIDFVKTVADRLGIEDYEVRSLPKLSAGQAETVLFAGLEDGESFIVYNIDTALNPKHLFSGMSSSDGWGLCFRAPGDHWSFFRTGVDGSVVEVREKERISDLCSVGLYYFRSFSIYKECYERTYGQTQGSVERYIAPIYQTMIDRGYKVTVSEIPAGDVACMGTPAEYVAAMEGLKW